jgi:allophanate hydrolase subunit 1
MTKVQISYKLSRTLDDKDFESISRLTSVYGIFFAKIAPSLDTLLIEYDASRLTHSQLQAVLERHGLPIKIPVP